jgi:hypothetical protein
LFGPATPVPKTAIVCGEVLELSEMLSVDDRGPIAPGTKYTEM